MRKLFDGKPFDQAGAPPALDEAKLQQIITCYQQSIVMGTVANLIGHSRDTLRSWLDTGESDHKMGYDTIFARLFSETRLIVGKKAVELEKMIENTVKGWQRFGWLLERTLRRDYSMYGDLLDDLNAKIEGILQKQIQRDQAKVVTKEIGTEIREWLNDRVQAQNKALLEGKGNHGKADSEGTEKAT